MGAAQHMSTFVEVRRAGLAETRVVTAPLADPEPGQVLLAVGECALTANNITYAAFGDAMRYWEFFPPHGGDDHGAPAWGRVPVWGVAEVVASTVGGIAEGERVYGYFPLGTHLVVEPQRVSDRGFVDGTAHRAGLPAVYNQYQRIAAGDDPAQTRIDRVRAVMRPLFTTSFLIDDWLAEQSYAGAEALVIGSASSKTALALAYLAHARGDVEVIGLTSPRNAAFVTDVGSYDRVVTYTELASSTTLAEIESAVYVDMSGAGDVTAAVHHVLGERLRISCQVGATHWRDVGRRSAGDGPLPGPATQFFFAPDHMHRADSRVDTAYDGFVDSATWMRFREVRGAEQVAAVFAEVRDGTVGPDEAVIVRVA